MESKRRAGYLESCQAVAIGKYGVDHKVVMAWTEKAFENDYLNGLTPSEAVEARLREVPGEGFLTAEES